ncbi:DUF3667 domain-containing protein [Paucibacter sp. R3-3]|uniref:DUF3667 domain-containing protein n=1 Tax=Roseateles agri TaxID=3098619 RepID=A0ABU5DJG4_9BURK|nr:DUF3667 domain-containing protein [Paucibacter sp. R3-3]MDY0745878.1 DUF3667 domain-containing protein [Paucibacter sp. R3-3]
MSAAHDAHAAAAPYCLNCHYTLSAPRPRHCGHCGQETDLHPPSMHEFVHEYVGHYVALEGPLWRTLWALIALPGRLTREYFAGRRRRYVLPLRIYLTASFIFFAGNHFIGTEAEQTPDREIGAVVQGAPNSPKESIEVLADEMKPCLKDRSTCGWVDYQFVSAMERIKHTSMRALWQRLVALQPYAMLLMQPVFAALLLLMFAGSGRPYAEHFVFSLHMHAFWFLALLLANAIGSSDIIQFYAFGHGLAALRTVYERGWWGSIWRGLLLALLYLTLLLMAEIGWLIVAALTSH